MESSSSSSVMDNFKSLVKSSQTFLKSAFNNNGSIDNKNNNNHHNHNPVDILKRLQREAFSEVMKLRERQEKLERSLLFHKFTNDKPSTHFKAIINVIGSLLIFDDDFLDSTDRLERSGTKTGVSSRFMFETGVRERDNLIAEFGTTGFGSFGLNRLMYNANLNEFLSLVLIPFGARCNNFRLDSDFKQGKSDDSYINSPPLFQQFHDFAIGLTLKRNNFGASIAQLISGPSMVNAESAEMDNCHLTTFGEITYKPLEDFKISLSTLFQIRKPSSYLVRISELSFPLFHLKKSVRSDVLLQSTGTDAGTGTGTNSSQSITININCEYLESTKLDGWIELNRPLSENSIKFGGSFCDLPENEIGWGLRSGGVIKENFERFQMEGFLNFEIGKGGNAKLQPGIVFVTEGGNRVVALVLKSCWFI